MAIDYGFGMTSPDNRGAWVEMFTRLNESEKEYFHSVFPPLMMAAGIKHISETTIPHILARLAMLDAPREHGSYRKDLQILHVLAVHGMEAAKKVQAARKAAQKLVEDSLPDGFEPDAAKALERFIGYTTNVRTETSHEFLKSLGRMRDHLPKLTSGDIMTEDRDFCGFARAVASCEIPHPALKEAVPA